METAMISKTIQEEALSGTEGAPRASGVPDRVTPSPSPEVSDQPRRRRFTADYKLRILRETDGCREYGQLGALLRREGVYSSTLRLWRKQREEGSLTGLGGKKRGRKPLGVDPRVKQLEKEKARLQRQLREAEIIIEYQKKIAKLLRTPLKDQKADGNG